MTVAEPPTVKGRATRDRVLDAATALVFEHGVAGTTLARYSRRRGREQGGTCWRRQWAVALPRRPAAQPTPIPIAAPTLTSVALRIGRRLALLATPRAE
jgi:hypothetical protein